MQPRLEKTQLSNAPRYYTHFEIDQFLSDLKSTSADLQKAALRNICDGLERGRRLAPHDRRSIISELINHITSKDFKVRQWLYKLIALIHGEEYIGILVHHIREREDHSENISWAFAALASVAPYNTVVKLIKQEFGSRILPYHALSARLYSNANFSLYGQQDIIFKSLDKDPLTAKWIALLFGFGRLDDSLISKFPPSSIIPALNHHHDPEVVEYSVWSIFRSSHLYTPLVDIPISSFSNQPPNVRRWLYRLLLSEKGEWSVNLDFLSTRIQKERAIAAREGLALGLRRCYHERLVNDVIQWYYDQNKAVIHDALLGHIARFADLNTHYYSIVQEVLTPDEAIPRRDQLLIRSLSASLPREHPVVPLINNTMYGSRHELHLHQMTKTVKTVNITAGGNVVATALNVDNIRDAVINQIASDMKAANLAPVQTLFRDYLTKIDGDTEVPSDLKTDILDTISDLSKQVALESQGQPTIIQKGLRVLRGIAAELPNATSFVTNTNLFVEQVKKLLGL